MDYTFDWTQDRIQWIIDGVTLATVTRAAAGAQYPQIPARVSIGIWCPGCSGSSQVGARITENLDTYVATLSLLEITNYNPAIQYRYRDMSGTESSVVIDHKSTSSSKITGGVIAGIVVGAVVCILIVIGLVVYCLRRRNKDIKPVQHDDFSAPRTNYMEVNTPSKPDTDIPMSLRYPEERYALHTPDARAGGRLGTSLETPQRSGQNHSHFR